MPKASSGRNGKPKKPSTAHATKGARRIEKQRSVLEQRLAEADALIARRMAQLDVATERRATLLARIAAFAGDDPARDEVAAPVGVQAYCMREKTRVTILDPRPAVLSNGRIAVAGTCPNCGAKVMRMVSRAEQQAGTASPAPG